MEYTFPDEATLVKYLALLSKVIILARRSAFSSDKQMAQLLDAVHNIPDLLCRWQDVNETWILEDLERYEAKYCRGNDPFSGIIKRGPAPGWQGRWSIPKDSTGSNGA